MAGKKATHRVICAVCGRNGKIEVTAGGRIADEKWNFFGRFRVNYEAAASILKLEEPDYAVMRPEPVEYWECKNCFSDIESALKQTR